MRAIVAALILSASLTGGATAQSSQLKTDPMIEPNAEQSAQAELLMNIQEFAKKLEEAGYQDLRLVLQGVLIKAKDKSGKTVMMLFDPGNLVAMQVTTPEPETTGSGSSEPRFPSEEAK
jgi:hypothetical protein